MDNKQKEQLKKGLVFGGLGLLFALSMWFIFAPSGKDKTAGLERQHTAGDHRATDGQQAKSLRTGRQGARGTTGTRGDGTTVRLLR